jgi:hypothetical protein
VGGAGDLGLDLMLIVSRKQLDLQTLNPDEIIKVRVVNKMT